MKMLQFYKLYDWMLDEFGASTDAALLSIVYSFEELGTECRLSYTQFAEILKVSRPKAIDRIRKLIESGYLIVTRDSTHTNIYRVNRKAFQSASNENGTSYNSTSNEIGTSTSNEIGTSTSNEIGTSTSNEKVTQIDIYRELKREDKRERERSVKSAAPPTPEEVKLYFSEIGCTENPQTFHDYYTARSWQGIRDWKAAARAWMQRGQRQQPTPRTPQRSHTEPEQLGHIDIAAIQAKLDAGGIYEAPKR